VRDPGVPRSDLTVPAEARALMVEVIEQRRRNFDLNRLRKLYPPRVKQLLDAKAAAGGERITVPEPKKAAPRDLVAALKGSVSKARRDRAAA
jgi:non-homologous end joining protein Ku